VEQLTKEEMILLERILKVIQVPLMSEEAKILRGCYEKIMKELDSDGDMDTKAKVE
jgi:hypothetical protein